MSTLSKFFTRLLAGLISIFIYACAPEKPPVYFSGEAAQWHTLTLTFEGPETEETNPVNPFLNYRLEVLFRNGDRQLLVPGFYAADGNAANSGRDRGNKWQVRFTPPVTGVWEYRAFFREGENIALSDDPGVGLPVYFDGIQGTFQISPSDKQAPDFRSRGRLQYVGGHFLRFAGDGSFFLKGGADSPENLLAYADFDGTADLGGMELPGLPGNLHRYEPHLADWQEGDPTWRKGKGKGIIGAMNYLASEGINSQYFITMNVKGDGQDVWPWVRPDDFTRFDVSKLEQWEIVFAHMEKLGIGLNLVTQERENDTLLNRGSLGPERMLYYRELIARFGHHLALTWHLGEETTRTTSQIKADAAFFKTHDPYLHPIFIHTNIREADGIPDPHEKVYRPLLGYPFLDGPSLQVSDTAMVHAEVIKWRTESGATTHPWVVHLDEIGHWNIGVTPDGPGNNHAMVRHTALWGALLGGAAGVEWYFGYADNGPNHDLSCEDFRSRDQWWDYNRYAHDFFVRHLPFWEMEPADKLVSSAEAYCLARPGSVYAIYVPFGNIPDLDLENHEGTYSLSWYDPRKGGALQIGSREEITGGGKVKLGSPPNNEQPEWVILIKRK